MVNSKAIIFSIILSIMAIIFQAIPALFSERFIFFTVLSTLPIYVLSRYNPRLGLFSYFAVGFLVMVFSVHEGTVFLLTNGIIGYVLGMCRHYIQRSSTIIIISSIILTATLGIMNYLAEIPALKISVFGGVFTQIILWFGFSMLYCYSYLKIGNFLYGVLNRFYYLEADD